MGLRVARLGKSSAGSTDLEVRRVPGFVLSEPFCTDVALFARRWLKDSAIFGVTACRMHEGNVRGACTGILILRLCDRLPRGMLVVNLNSVKE